MKFSLTLNNISDARSFIANCNELKSGFSPNTADGIIEFACAVATLSTKPDQRVQTFVKTVDKVLALINEVKAQYREEGMDVRYWGFELCYDCEQNKQWEQIRRGNNVTKGIVLYLDEEHSELYDWTK